MADMAALPPLSLRFITYYRAEGGTVSAYQRGDVVRWKREFTTGRGSDPFTVTEAGLESSSPVMPGEQVRVRKPDGSQARVWTDDIELVCRAVG